jgi:pyruvate formate lyase activating enzyme
MPLIPGVNDDPENIRETAVFLQALGPRALRIELMPYHRLGTGKYESLDLIYPMAELMSPEPVQVERAKNAFQELGIACTVSR